MSRSVITIGIGLTVLLALATVGAVAGQSPDLADALEEIGVTSAHVTVSDDSITIAYEQSIASLGPWESVLYRIAAVVAVAEENTDQELPVIQQITYDDGNVMQITGEMDDAAAFLDGQLSPDEYDLRLDFQPLTRGPVIVGEICEVAEGDTCAGSEACACYANESCKPDSEAADVRGCVVDSEPENAHLQNGQVVCDPGYVWNDDLTACELPQACPAGTFRFNGDCVTHSRQSQSEPGPTPTGNGGSRGAGSVIVICGAGLCLMIPLGIVVALVIRRGRQRRSAETVSGTAPTATRQGSLPTAPHPVPPPPPLPASFRALEQRYAQLQHAYATGQCSEGVYHQELQKLVVQDVRGHWAYSAGRWMWFDGTAWVPRGPR